MAGGRTVLACMNTGGVSRLWDAETGASAGDDLQADFTPLSVASIRLGDTTLLIATSDEGEVVAWNPATGERLRHSLEGLSAAAFRPAHGPAILAVGTCAVTSRFGPWKGSSTFRAEPNTIPELREWSGH